MQSGLKEILGTELSIVPDTNEAVANEIVIGNADRRINGVKLSINEYCVYIDSGRLVIASGHNALLTTAVTEFIKLAENATEIPEFSGFGNEIYLLLG